MRAIIHLELSIAFFAKNEEFLRNRIRPIMLHQRPAVSLRAIVTPENSLSGA
jgi:hypothetical protein